MVPHQIILYSIIVSIAIINKIAGHHYKCWRPSKTYIGRFEHGKSKNHPMVNPTPTVLAGADVNGNPDPLGFNYYNLGQLVRNVYKEGKQTDNKNEESIHEGTSSS